MTERLEAETDRRRPLPRRCTASARGGMADVYCAEDLQLGRKVALKLLLPPLRRGQRVRRALPPRGVERRRACSTSTSSSVYDRGEWDGTYYIAMEYLEGRSLKAIVQQEAPLDPDARDRPDHPDPARRALRPPPRDHPPRPQAPQRDRRRRGPRQGHRLRHRPRRRVGHDADRARSWAPRSTCRPSRPRATRSARASDLYSIGIILYELLTGRVPFEGESAVTIALKQVNERPDAAERLQPGGHAGARGGRAARAGEGPGAPLPRRRRVHRRAGGRRATARADAPSLARGAAAAARAAERGLRLPRGAAAAARGARAAGAGGCGCSRVLVAGRRARRACCCCAGDAEGRRARRSSAADQANAEAKLRQRRLRASTPR